MKQVKKQLIFSMVAVGIFMSTLDSSIINLALPTIQSSFKTSLAYVQWVIIVYLLTITSLLLSFGRLSDIIGRRLVYVRGLLIFTAGSLLCAFSQNLEMFIASRTVQGIGASMIMSCTQALVVDTFPKDERGKTLGMIGAVVAIGLMSGPPLGGFLLHYFSWRSIFIINIPIGIFACFFSNSLLKGTKADLTRKEPFDLPGSILLLLTLTSFLLATNQGYNWGYSSIETLSLFGFSLISFGIMLYQRKRSKHPVIALGLFNNRLFTMSILASIIAFLCLFMVVFLMPYFLVHPSGFSVDKAGMIMVTPFICLFAAAPFAGAMSDKIGSAVLCTLGMAVTFASLLSMAYLTPSGRVFPAVWRLALSGLGIALFISPNSAAALSSVDEDKRGIGSGFVASARNLGMVLGIAAAGSIFNTVYFMESGGMKFKNYSPDLLPFFMKAFQHAMWFGAATALIGVAVAYLRGNDGEIRSKN